MLGPETVTAKVKRGLGKEVADAKHKASTEKKKDAGGGGGWFGAPAAADTKPKAAERKWDPFAPVKGPGLALGPGKVKGEVIISGVLKNGPADLHSGVLKVGDVVVGVDGQSVKGLSVEGVSAKLRGPDGSEVHIKVERRGEQYLHATVRRRPTP